MKYINNIMAERETAKNAQNISMCSFTEHFPQQKREENTKMHVNCESKRTL